MVKSCLMIKVASHYTRPGVPIETATSENAARLHEGPSKGRGQVGSPEAPDAPEASEAPETPGAPEAAGAAEASEPDSG